LPTQVRILSLPHSPELRKRASPDHDHALCRALPSLQFPSARRFADSGHVPWLPIEPEHVRDLCVVLSQRTRGDYRSRSRWCAWSTIQPLANDRANDGAEKDEQDRSCRSCEALCPRGFADGLGTVTDPHAPWPGVDVPSLAGAYPFE
jgi:hypothetical protein